VVDELEVAKRCEVVETVLGHSGHEADGAGDDAGDQELVVVDWRAAFGVGVDGDGAVMLPVVAGGASADLPGRRVGLGVFEFGGGVEGRSRGFDCFEVTLWLLAVADSLEKALSWVITHVLGHFCAESVKGSGDEI
jgi:hypothetical protein